MNFPNFFNPFSFIKQKIAPVYLGVDIGTTSIKIVEVERGKQLPRLSNYCILEDKSSLLRANTAIQTSSLKLFEDEVVGLLKSALREMKPRTNEAIASLPTFSAFTTILTFPEMSKEDLEKSILFGMKQYIPLPISEVAVDWMKVGEYKDEKGFLLQQILLISVPQEQIKKYKKIFKDIIEVRNPWRAEWLDANFKKQNIIPYLGLQVNIDGILGIIRTVTPGRAIIDFNHPLSGKNLIYKRANKWISLTPKLIFIPTNLRKTAPLI